MFNSRRSFLRKGAGLLALAPNLAAVSRALGDAPGVSNDHRIDDGFVATQIEKIRKGDITVSLRSGKGAVSATVNYALTRLGFDVGTVLYRSTYTLPESDQESCTVSG